MAVGMTPGARDTMMDVFRKPDVYVTMHEVEEDDGVSSYDDIMEDRRVGLFGRQCTNRVNVDPCLRATIVNPLPGVTEMYYVLWRNGVPQLWSNAYLLFEGDSFMIDLYRDLKIF